MSKLKSITAERIRVIGKIATSNHDQFYRILQSMHDNDRADYVELVCVMHIGRGDDDPERYDLLHREQTVIADEPHYIYEKHRLFEQFVLAGLKALGE